MMGIFFYLLNLSCSYDHDSLIRLRLVCKPRLGCRVGCVKYGVVIFWFVTIEMMVGDLM